MNRIIKLNKDDYEYIKNRIKPGTSLAGFPEPILSILGFMFTYEDEIKMTREEAIDKFYDIMYAKDNSSVGEYAKADRMDNDKKWAKKAITAYEALGLIKFDENKKYTSVTVKGVNGADWETKYGAIRVEEWPEGLVVWVGGEIRHKSWEKSSPILTVAGETLFTKTVAISLDDAIKAVQNAGYMVIKVK